MAKSIGLVGTLSGKAGNFVFCKGSDGRTIVRPYQPQVYNPKTTAQSLQRSKMVLAGKLSSLCPSELLVSMGMGRKVANRAAFVRNLLRRAEADVEGGNYIPSLLAEDLVFGRGSVQSHVTLDMDSYTTLEGPLEFDYVPVGVTNDMVNKIGVRTVVVCASKEPTQQVFDDVVYTDTLITSSSARIHVTIPLPDAVEDKTMLAVYSIPFELTEEAASQFAGEGGIYAPNALGSIKAILTTNPSVVKEWGDSRLASEGFEAYVRE